MRVTNIGLYASNYSGDLNEAITFALLNVSSSDQYMIRNIVGLDAEEIIPKFYGIGSYSKDKFYDFGMKSREIVMRIALNPRFRIDESYSDIRDELYRVISATRTGIVVLHFSAGPVTVASARGFITKFEVAYFNELPEVQLTIHCNDGIFRAITPVIYEASELKTTNPILVPDSISTAPHGFSMQVTFKATSPSFTIQDVPTNPDWTFKVTPSGGFLANDILYFSSDYSNKYLYLVRGGSTTYLVDKINPNSIWPIIFPGTNEFHFVDIAKINWNILEYYPAYWGV